MNKIVSQIPQLQDFLKRIKPQEQTATIKELIMIGLNVVSSSLHSFPQRCECLKENKQGNINIAREIQKIKANIQQLNNLVQTKGIQSQQAQFHECSACSRHQYMPENAWKRSQEPSSGNLKIIPQRDQEERTQKIVPDSRTYSFSPKRQPLIRTHQVEKSKEKLTPKITQVIPQFDERDIRRKAYSRHHLDDTELRLAMRYPNGEAEGPQKNKKGRQYNAHLYQQQINREQLGKIKYDNRFEQIRTNKQRSAFSNQLLRDGERFKKTKSKIKTLIDRDRLRHNQRVHQQQFREGFNKYEYSDENQMEESSVSSQRAPVNFHHENTYDEQYRGSSAKGSFKNSSQKISERKEDRSRNEASSKYEASSKNDLRLKRDGESKQNSQQQQRSGSHNLSLSGRPSIQKPQRQQDKPDQSVYDDVISNSSSFSQFSINGSRREVGKISRRRD